MNGLTNSTENELRQATEDACVDCYDASEQIMGLANMVEEEFAFPFAASVIGESVEVISASQSQFDSLDWI